MRQIDWLDRKFTFDFPAGVFPGVVERLRGTPQRIYALIHGVSDETLGAVSGAAWSVKQHIGHLDDLDALDRIRLQEFVRGAAMLSAADMTNRRTHEAGYGSMTAAELLGRFRKHRLDLVDRMESLEEAVVSRTALHPRLHTSMRLVDWAYFVAEHDDHHVARIRELLR